MTTNTENPENSTLDEVFVTRSKIGKYFSIPDEKRDIMLQYFQKNPYPKKDELLMLSQRTGIEKNKIQNWFKYQRQKDFKTEKTIIKTYKCNRKFSREGKKILELYFRKSHELSENALKKLSVILKCEKSQIERWFYYRNKKLNTLLNKKDKSMIKEEETDNSKLEDKTFVKKVEEQEKNGFDAVKTEEPSKDKENLAFSSAFQLPAFNLPPPKFLSSPFNGLWPSLSNLSMMNEMMMNRNELYQRTISSLMPTKLKVKEEAEEFTVKREEEEVKIKEEEGN